VPKSERREHTRVLDLAGPSAVSSGRRIEKQNGEKRERGERERERERERDSDREGERGVERKRERERERVRERERERERERDPVSLGRSKRTEGARET
jgi:hypothetical protein